jgi:hypothetical protein
MIDFAYKFYLRKKNILTHSLSNWIYWQLFKFLKWSLPIYYSNMSIHKLKTSPESDIVVHLTIKSILNQTCPPKSVLLWLANEQFPDGENKLPIELLNLKKKGLKIEFCDDLKSHKKYFYAFQKFSENRIVTIDDDVFYPNDMLKILKYYSDIYPEEIIANRIREIAYVDSKIIPYRKWKINQIRNSMPSKSYMPTGVGGVLYKASFFSNSLYSKESIKMLCLNADDVWLKANSLHNNKKVVFTCNYFNELIEVKGSQVESLYSQNVFKADNDIQIQEVFDLFSIRESNFLN